MASVNRVILLGHLGKDPETRHLPGEIKLVAAPLATSESYKDKDGNRVEKTEWHNLEFWGFKAQIAEKYLSKGSQIYIEGKIKTESWQDKDGNNRKTTKITVSDFTMLGGKKEDESISTSTPREPYQSATNPVNDQPIQGNILEDMGNDDLPF